MSHLFEFLTSPLYHLALAFVAIAALMNVPLLNRPLSFKLHLAGVVCFGCFEAICLPFGYYMESGYGFTSAFVDAYEGIVSPLIPLAMSLIVGCAGIILMIASAAVGLKPRASVPVLPLF